MRNIVIEFPKITPIEKQAIELVERKGVGHPDSVCDGIAEAVSRALSVEYIKRFDRILHHNTDQVELIGGEAKPEFGGGKITKPMYLLLGGRATTSIEDEVIPVGEIAINAVEKYMRENFKNLDVDSVEIDQRIGQGSADLRAVFEREGIPRSNDTSFGVGFAPLSTTERLVLETERYINNGLRMKEVGEDVKVMGIRNKESIVLTIACAMVSKYIKDLDHYISLIEEMHSKLVDFAAKITEREVHIDINTGDDYEKGSVYLTITGMSAEQGDDGSVGRGNRANGLITPYRPMSLEATAGKNPVNHVGKIYNLLSNKIAHDIAEEGAEQVYVRIMSQIGKPIDQPLIASVQLIGDKSLESRAKRIVDNWLENITDITQLCVEGKISVF
ncbi:MAG: methionine adenosyltransferase [Candidatus Altiarchaeales archaeon]|nr:MAG: methionine adenosyltransferase [Candidatus Altiarchaeales archaeon]